VGVVRVLVVAPHPLLREGIRLSLLGTGWEVSAEAADLQSAMTAVQASRPDACLVDADLPGGGLAAVREIVRAHPQAAVVVLADRYSDADLLEAVRAGAMGYLDKDIRSDRLPGVIRAALAGEAVIPRRLVGRLMTEVRTRPATPNHGDDGSQILLTRREVEVLELMREGLTTSRIAERLFVSPVTVRSHVMSMVRKLHVSDRAALLLRPDDPPGPPRTAAL
jgi:DNA-binding NarL/FixJ family response regulator